ncbi:Alkaline phosphatase-like, alpha/beta/alpha [Metarhizium guizhouense ARSEF 977]|uniref:Alkaline phosphatase n=1 Tax=Metarhizium guizhouense (strain ARSEF 977) TaxID=1276136 RepID=A0A0B4HNQ5_METGA|nr:Alkaline phosphatase-like, alpha/beta/alpha [Metarhizium guizhouense ARSEF 977]
MLLSAILMLLASALSSPASAAPAGKVPSQRVRNFIYVVPNGFGPASQTLWRDYINIINKNGTELRPNSTATELDRIMIGTVRTQSFDKFVTDSAAAATAFATGHKTHNTGVGIDSDVKPVASILEAAHLEGFKTGLVVTSRVTDATPAGYCAHVMDRNLEVEIASHQIGQKHPLGSVVDLIMGGGRRHYQTQRPGRNRTIDLITWAKGQGFSYAGNKRELGVFSRDLGKVPLPFLGLFADSHMAYELDRDNEKEPSLLQMMQIAIKTLSDATMTGKEGINRPKGFFLMIEASRIGHAGHANDVAAHIHDIAMYYQVMSFLRKYAAENPDTQILSAADHETGGLTLATGYNPAMLERANHTSEYLERAFALYQGQDRATYLRNVILPQYGLLSASDKDVKKYLDVLKRDGISEMGSAIRRDFAKSAGITWATDGHSAVDVALYGFAAGDKAYSQMKASLGPHADNTQLARYMESALGVSLNKATEALRENWVKFEGYGGKGGK